MREAMNKIGFTPVESARTSVSPAPQRSSIPSIVDDFINKRAISQSSSSYRRSSSRAGPNSVRSIGSGIIDKPDDGTIGASRRYDDDNSGVPKARAIIRNPKNMTCEFQNGHLCGSPSPGTKPTSMKCGLCGCKGHTAITCRCPTCALTNHHDPALCPRLNPKWKCTLHEKNSRCHCDDTNICYQCLSRVPLYYLVQKSYYDGKNFVGKRMPLYRSYKKDLLEKLSRLLNQDSHQCMIVDNLNTLIITDKECLSSEFKEIIDEMNDDATSGFFRAISEGIMSRETGHKVYDLIKNE
jgi:hypothetical protein